ncbi:MAG: NfeD family protein [Anaerorhabdus sp.]
MIFWLWIIVLIASLIIELLTSTALLSIWFAAGAIAALIVLELGWSITIQIAIFLIVSLAFIGFCRPLVKRYTQVNFIPTNADRFIGQQVQLLSAITPSQWGTIKIQGIEWHAISTGEHIEADTLVEIIAIEGSKVIVKSL